MTTSNDLWWVEKLATAKQGARIIGVGDDLRN